MQRCYVHLTIMHLRRNICRVRLLVSPSPAPRRHVRPMIYQHSAAAAQACPPRTDRPRQALQVRIWRAV